MRKEKRQHGPTQHYFSKLKSSAGFIPLEKNRSERLKPRLQAERFQTGQVGARPVRGRLPRATASSNRGFTLLYSVLVASLLLSIGLAILNISIKEVMLSGSARDSQLAFYAADAGLECALYWDHSSLNKFKTQGNEKDIFCRGQGPFPVGGQGLGNPTGFTFDFKPDAESCVIVTVVKNNISGILRTVITSRGFNTCDADNPRRVERTLEARF